MKPRRHLLPTGNEQSEYLKTGQGQETPCCLTGQWPDVPNLGQFGQCGWSESWGSLLAVPHRRPTHYSKEKHLMCELFKHHRGKVTTIVFEQRSRSEQPHNCGKRITCAGTPSPSNGQPNDTVELPSLTALTWLRAFRTGFGPKPHVPVSA